MSKKFTTDIEIDGKIIKKGGVGSNALMDNGTTRLLPTHVSNITTSNISSWDGKVNTVKARLVQISEDDLPTNFTIADIRAWFNTNGVIIARGEIIVWETTQGAVTVTTYTLTINAPTGGQQFTTGDNIVMDITIV